MAHNDGERNKFIAKYDAWYSRLVGVSGCWTQLGGWGRQ